MEPDTARILLGPKANANYKGHLCSLEVYNIVCRNLVVVLTPCNKKPIKCSKYGEEKMYVMLFLH